MEQNPFPHISYFFYFSIFCLSVGQTRNPHKICRGPFQRMMLEDNCRNEKLCIFLISLSQKRCFHVFFVSFLWTIKRRGVKLHAHSLQKNSPENHLENCAHRKLRPSLKKPRFFLSKTRTVSHTHKRINYFDQEEGGQEMWANSRREIRATPTFFSGNRELFVCRRRRIPPN